MNVRLIVVMLVNIMKKFVIIQNIVPSLVVVIKKLVIKPMVNVKNSKHTP